MRIQDSHDLADSLGAYLANLDVALRARGYTEDEILAELATQLGARFRHIEARRTQRRDEMREREAAAARPAPALDLGAASRFARFEPENATGAADAMALEAALGAELERTLDDVGPPSWFVRVFCDESSTRALVKTEIELLLAGADAAVPRAIVDAALVAAGPGWRAHVDTGADRRVDVRLWRAP
jgi:hypothetical protein